MEMERELARGRGDIVCTGLVSKDNKKGDGVKYGVTEPTLKERFAARRDVSFEPFSQRFADGVLIYSAQIQ